MRAETAAHPAQPPWPGWSRDSKGGGPSTPSASRQASGEPGLLWAPAWPLPSVRSRLSRTHNPSGSAADGPGGLFSTPEANSSSRS